MMKGREHKWELRIPEGEDCFWEIYDVTEKGHFQICSAESNQWAGRRIMAALAVVEAAKNLGHPQDHQCHGNGCERCALNAALTAMEAE